MIFNDVSGLWTHMEENEVRGLFISAVSSLRRRYTKYLKEEATDIWRDKISELSKAESSNFLQGSMKMLTSLKGMSIDSQLFDSDHYLVGLKNGMCLDLRQVEVRPITKSDYLSKCADVEFLPDASCELWEKSVLEWCCGDKELYKFLQVWCGYCLSGLTEVQGFLFLYGSGRNGKSVFLSVLSDLLDGYHQNMDSSSIILKASNNGPRSDIVRLNGARFVTSVEVPQGYRIDENFIKQLTGGDLVTARGLYQSEFNFQPVLKLMISGNHKPVVTGTDFGFWRRVKVVPFNADIQRPDQQLTQKLLLEASGILNWMIEGWKIYQSEGLKVPECVRRESDNYKSDMDLLLQWKEDCISDSAKGRMGLTLTYKCYEFWAKNFGYRALNLNQFKREVSRFFGDPKRDAKGNFYSGYSINEEYVRLIDL